MTFDAVFVLTHNITSKFCSSNLKNRKNCNMNRNSSSSSKQQPSTSNSKPKKTAKDRDKRKSQSEQQQTATEKNNTSPSKENGNTRQYAGISGDSIALYAEQTSSERYTEEVCDRLAEDINYKLRQIIHTAMVKARLSGRNGVHATDVEETFNSLNLDKVYGAPSNPEFIPFGDESLYYLNDTKVNLIDLADQEISCLQPADVTLERKWIPDESEVSETLKKYFKTCCDSLVGNEHRTKLIALLDVESNCHIGRIIDWFYNFAYFLLSRHSSCEHLTVCALSLIESLEANPTTDLSVSEKQLSLLTRLLLQKIFSLPPKSNLLRYTCTTLALLCKRYELRKTVFAILTEKADEIKSIHPVSFLTLINSMGGDAVADFFCPNVDYFLIKSQEDVELKFELLVTYNVIFKERLENDALCEKYLETFGVTTCLYRIPKEEEMEDVEMVEKPTGFDCFILSVIEQKNSLTMAVNLMKTRRKLQIPNYPRTETDLNSVFDCNHESNAKIIIKGNNLKEANSRKNVTKIYEERKRAFGDKKDYVIVGRTTLLASVFKNVQYDFKKPKCNEHSLININL